MPGATGNAPDSAPHGWMRVAVCTTTVGSPADAQRLAHGAVQARQAACAQTEPIHSHYIWQGAACDEPEWRVVFKTPAHAAEALAQWLREAHPYDLPQLLLRHEWAAPDYAAWVAQQVSEI